ncbi:type II toxin-antitoxin system Phd/YefM family antitoxin [Homoserinimonas sp. A447]
MARTIAHRELRNNSSAILRDVQAGETITITNHGEPVAVLSPVTDQPMPNVRVKRATIKGRFSEIESRTSKLPSAEILEELRAER